jgi:UDPglucose 6-dehydrogenase
VKVGILGTGHVGLITCVTLASIGHDVVGVDADPEKTEALQRGVAPFFEPGLSELLAETMAQGHLRFSSDAVDAVHDAEVVFICVGTPPMANGHANLIAMERAAREIARHATGPTVIVEKSTVPAGTAQRVAQVLQRERPDLAGQLEVVSNPEFLREGNAIVDSLHPDRILVGAESTWAVERMRRLYGPIVDDGAPLIETTIATAELAKHACNAFLALKISFVNALARVCERAGADVVSVADVMGTDPRIGPQFLAAGIGYGGYCFPKDLMAFEKLSKHLGYDFPLLAEVARINQEAVEAAVVKVRDALWNIEDKTVALFGLSFKAGTDDVRFSPALSLARRLLEEGAVVRGYDPEASPNAKDEVPELEIASDPYDAAAGAHCVVICTGWDEFRQLDLAKLREVMLYPTIVDGRNLFEGAEVAEAGFAYYPTGRPARP